MTRILITLRWKLSRSLVKTDMMVMLTIIVHDTPDITFIAIVITVVLIAGTFLGVHHIGRRVAGWNTSPFRSAFVDVLVLELLCKSIP